MSTYDHLRFSRHWNLSSKTHYELGQCDAIVQAIANAPLLPEYHRRLLLVSLTKGAQATTAIEGNTLSEEEIEQVVEGKSLPPSKQYQEQEVRNILEAFNILLQEVAVHGYAERISADLLRRFHQMIGKELGKHFDAIPGRFREDHRRVGPYHTPAFQDVPELVTRLCDWLPREFRYEEGQTFAEAVIQAIVTHVYIEWIHPFADGNGRTGRLVEFYLLLRAGNPDIASHILSNHYNETRTEYYRQIQLAHDRRDLSAFIEYAVQGFRDGLLRTLQTIQANQFDITWVKLIYDRFAEKQYTRKSTFVRQRRLALALPRDRVLTAKDVMELTPAIARDYATLSGKTVQRDLETLVAMGLASRSERGYAAGADVLRQQVPVRRATNPGAPS